MFGRSSGKIDVPSMPAALTKVIQITNTQDASFEEVAAVVMLDPALSIKVLRLAISACHEKGTRVETISEAVAILGFVSVRNLAASASVVDALFTERLFPGFSWQEMWIHSVTCAVSAELIYSHMSGSREAGETAFAAGLLHDIGKLILARALPQRFLQIIETCRESKIDMISVESDLLGTDHAKIGGELTEQWEFPEKLCVGISYHHMPEVAPYHEDLARAVYAANLLAKRLGKSYIVGVSFEIGLRDVAEAADIPISEMQYIVEEIQQKLRQCNEILSCISCISEADRAMVA